VALEPDASVANDPFATSASVSYGAVAKAVSAPIKVPV
jgi:hypothetical protein